jgi:hypothetical protein
VISRTLADLGHGELVKTCFFGLGMTCHCVGRKKTGDDVFLRGGKVSRVKPTTHRRFCANSVILGSGGRKTFSMQKFIVCQGVTAVLGFILSRWIEGWGDWVLWQGKGSGVRSEVFSFD